MADKTKTITLEEIFPTIPDHIELKIYDENEERLFYDHKSQFDDSYILQCTVIKIKPLNLNELEIIIKT